MKRRVFELLKMARLEYARSIEIRILRINAILKVLRTVRHQVAFSQTEAVVEAMVLVFLGKFFYLPKLLVYIYNFVNFSSPSSTLYDL